MKNIFRKKVSDEELFADFCKENLRMPFGKHKGELLEDVPLNYLYWFKTIVEYEDIRSKCTQILGDYTPPKRSAMNTAMFVNMLSSDILFKHHGHQMCCGFDEEEIGDLGYDY